MYYPWLYYTSTFYSWFVMKSNEMVDSIVKDKISYYYNWNTAENNPKRSKKGLKEELTNSIISRNLSKKKPLLVWVLKLKLERKKNNIV